MKNSWRSGPFGSGPAAAGSVNAERIACRLSWSKQKDAPNSTRSRHSSGGSVVAIGIGFWAFTRWDVAKPQGDEESAEKSTQVQLAAVENKAITEAVSTFGTVVPQAGKIVSINVPFEVVRNVNGDPWPIASARLLNFRLRRRADMSRKDDSLSYGKLRAGWKPEKSS